jgi:hypothetical protein
MEPHRRGISTESRGPHLIIVACAVLSQNTPLRFHSQHTTGHPPPSKSLEERSLEPQSPQRQPRHHLHAPALHQTATRGDRPRGFETQPASPEPRIYGF